MKFSISNYSSNIEEEKIDIVIKHNKNYNPSQLIDYIKRYSQDENHLFVDNKNGEKVEIALKDVLYFYSLKRKNYCKTKDNIYEIKNRLYRIDYNSFFAISRYCIVNFNHIKCFSTSTSTKLKLILDNDEILYVSRTKYKSICRYLDERSV